MNILSTLKASMTLSMAASSAIVTRMPPSLSIPLLSLKMKSKKSKVRLKS